MSGGYACLDRSHRPHWRVTQRHQNHSAFNGYHVTPSNWSEVVCPLDHGHGVSSHPRGLRWRTTAAYVDGLPDGEPL